MSTSFYMIIHLTIPFLEGRSVQISESCSLVVMSHVSILHSLE